MAAGALVGGIISNKLINTTQRLAITNFSRKGDCAEVTGEKEHAGLDELIVRNCAPTLAGIKTGSMFPYCCGSRRELMDALRLWNRRLGPKGVRMVPLQDTGSRTLLYLFRPDALKKALSNGQAEALLEKRGYHDICPAACVCRLIGRFREGGEFPHEVGIFLGYPPEDVCGFIDHKAQGHKCVGCWKVYGDEAAAKETFRRYKECTREYCAQWAQGRTVEQLTV